jgi:Holliday junction resolvase-like predicted endonuclease
MPVQRGAPGSAGREGNKSAHLALGKAGEEAAGALLERSGFRILDRNWRPAGARRGLELDLVAECDGTLVFVEVKTRRTAGRAVAAGNGKDVPGHGQSASGFCPRQTGDARREHAPAAAREEDIRIPGARPGCIRGHGNAVAHKEGIPVYAAFTADKRKRFAEAARRWLSAHAAWGRPCRFDVILVEQGADGTLYAERHADVLELGNIVGGGDPYWQPW